MCCNGTLHQNHKHPKKEIFSAEPQQCIQHLTPHWEWYHQLFNDEIPATSCYTKNSKIPFREILPFFSQIHKVNAEWPLQQSKITHLTSLAFAQSKQLFLTAGTAGQLTQPPEHCWFFHIWLKPKPTIETTFLLLKYLHFLLLFPQQLLPEIARIS